MQAVACVLLPEKSVENVKEQTAVSQEPAEFSIKTIILPLLAIIVGMIMVILDSTVVNVAIPNLVQYFETDLKTIQWTVTGYTLALSAVIPLAGWLTDRFGAKRVFLFTIAMFTLGSVLCSIAQSPEQLIIYRVIQGLGEAWLLLLVWRWYFDWLLLNEEVPSWACSEFPCCLPLHWARYCPVGLLNH